MAARPLVMCWGEAGRGTQRSGCCWRRRMKRDDLRRGLAHWHCCGLGEPGGCGSLLRGSFLAGGTGLVPLLLYDQKSPEGSDDHGHVDEWPHDRSDEPGHP
jgi:hypothetical protein